MNTSSLIVIQSPGSLTAPNAKYVSALQNPDKLDAMRQESSMPRGLANEHKILRDLVAIMMSHPNEVKVSDDTTQFQYSYMTNLRGRTPLKIRYWIRHHMASVFSDKAFVDSGTYGRYETYLFHYDRTMDFLRERLCMEHAEHVRGCEVFMS